MCHTRNITKQSILCCERKDSSYSLDLLLLKSRLKTLQWSWSSRTSGSKKWTQCGSALHLRCFNGWQGATTVGGIAILIPPKLHPLIQICWLLVPKKTSEVYKPMGDITLATSTSVIQSMVIIQSQVLFMAGMNTAKLPVPCCKWTDKRN